MVEALETPNLVITQTCQTRTNVLTTFNIEKKINSTNFH